MSGPDAGIIGRALGELVSHPIQVYERLAPYQQRRYLATAGTFLVAAAVFAAWWAPLFLGGSLRELAAGAWREPTEPPLAFAVWIGSLGLGALWIVVGLKGAHGPVDPLRAVSSLVMPAAAAFILWKWVGLEQLDNLILRGACEAGAAAYAMRFYLSVRGPRGAALPLVEANIAANEFEWDAPPRRRRWRLRN